MQPEARPLAMEAGPKGPVELVSVKVHPPDTELARFAGPNFLKSARDPLAIEVQTQNPLPTMPRDSSPVVVLNGEKLVDTWVFLPNRLVAFLPDHDKIQERNTVAATWIGAEALTMTKRPLTFARSDIGK